MKRFWIGIGILCALLILGSVAAYLMYDIHDQIAQLLQQAQAAAFEEDWETAIPLASKAHGLWKQYWSFTAAFADHTPMDELDGMFAELMVFAREQEMPHFAAICAHLTQLAGAMADSHLPSWWNLL